MLRAAVFFMSFLTLLVTAAVAEEITVSGCAATGTEANCLILKADGKIYDMTSAQPTPVPGTYGTLKGTLTDEPSTCQEGRIVDPAVWEIEPGKQCPIETSH